MSGRRQPVVTANGCYAFTSHSRGVKPSKYREPVSKQIPIAGLLMCDPRVVRGNPFVQCLIPTPGPAFGKDTNTSKKRKLGPKRGRTANLEPLATEHIEVQSERHLEELGDVIEHKDSMCQTDDFVDRLPSPLFIPAKSGEDIATQIEDGDLFDFDREVRPVVEVLVGKTVEQSLVEVMEEEELACMKAQQRAFQELRNIELMEVQRLQEAERRRKEEKERRIAQQREALRRERETAEKVAARALGQKFVANAMSTVFTSLRNQGFFYDPVENDVRTNFLPWLMSEVDDRLLKKEAARRVLDGLIYEVAMKREEAFRRRQT
ncbi:radial spoke head protein 3 homolog B-like [Antennarius striatus]|uniref:radial spoke head protein 3 homolog B-like n=1 Tax=Antennarius striatus TaxID=241820 RepID=UPI0035B019FA